jgi:hypothetical protein
VIGFYPNGISENKGFIIFNGYTTFGKESLPSAAEIYRIQSQLDCCAHYDIEITRVLRVDLQDKPLTPEEIEKQKCNCGPDDDCECHIVFFPSYIVIMEFNTIKKDTDFINKDIINSDIWNYCIDTRFNTPPKLLSAYSSLLELPDGCSFTNDSREEDLDFYLGYYKIYEEDNNIHSLTESVLDKFKDDLILHRENVKRRNEKREKEEKERKEKEQEEKEQKEKGQDIIRKLIGINIIPSANQNTSILEMYQ